MIRKLRATDSEDMAAIHAVSFETGWPEADMAEHIENDMALGFIHDDGLAGFILIRLSFEQSEILTIAVSPSHLRKGIGAKLLSAGETAVGQEDGDIIFLEVAEDNLAGIALYQSQGYQGFGRRPAYYKRAKGRVAARLFQKKL